MVRADVVVPEDSTPGQPFTIVMADGREVTIPCPEDAEPGDLLEIEIPSANLETEDVGSGSLDAEPDEEEMETVEVAIPDECLPGDSFTVQASWGGLFEVEVPRGTTPGATLFVELPAKPEPASREPTRVHPQLNI